MRGGFAVGLMLLLSVGLLVMGGSQAHGESAKPTTISVLPNKLVVSVGKTFSVDIWINNVADMRAWEIDLFWNRTIVTCIKARVNTPTEWGGLPFDTFNVSMSDLNPDLRPTAWIVGKGIINNCNETHGLYTKGEVSMPNLAGDYIPTFTGSLSVVTLTFQALQTGTTTLDFASRDQYGTTVVDRYGQMIAHTEYDGSVQVREPIVMQIQHALWHPRWVKK